jgi:hypothetical protein
MKTHRLRVLVANGALGALLVALCNGELQASMTGRTIQAQRTSLSDSLATWYALGINAHHLCAGLWVVGRDHTRTPDAVIAEDIARFPAFRWAPDFSYRVDAAAHTATVTAPRVGSRSAKYSGDQGCAILPAETTAHRRLLLVTNFGITVDYVVVIEKIVYKGRLYLYRGSITECFQFNLFFTRLETRGRM